MNTPNDVLTRYIADVTSVVVEAILFASASQDFRAQLTEDECMQLDTFVAHIEVQLEPYESEGTHE